VIPDLACGAESLLVKQLPAIPFLHSSGACDASDPLAASWEAELEMLHLKSTTLFLCAFLLVSFYSTFLKIRSKPKGNILALTDV
jgi:hypothetical protein